MHEFYESKTDITSGREKRMSRIEERLGEVGVTLPKLPTPLANYVPAKRAGNLVFTAGQVSAVEGRAYKGKLGATLGIEDGYAATRACVINCLAALKSVIGSLDHLQQIVAVHSLVNSTQDFDGQAIVMNGASDFLVEVFGEAGKHIRRYLRITLPTVRLVYAHLGMVS